MIHVTFFRCSPVTGPGRRLPRHASIIWGHRLGLPDHLLRDVGLLDGLPHRPAL